MATNYIHKNLDPPEDMLGDFRYYNPSSRIIVLQTQHGKMLSRFIGNEMPDARRFTFRTVFCPDHNTFQGNHAPSKAPADIEAFSHAVEKTRTPMQPPTAASPTDMQAAAPNPRFSKTYTADAGVDANQVSQSGMTVGLSHIDLYSGSGGGMKIDGSGVSVVGGFNQPNTQGKGVTKESNLFGILPKTVVTFTAADYLPWFKKLQKLQKWVVIALKLPKIYMAVQEALADMEDRAEDARDNGFVEDGYRNEERFKELDDASDMPGYRGLDNPDRGMGAE